MFINTTYRFVSMFCFLFYMFGNPSFNGKINENVLYLIWESGILFVVKRQNIRYRQHYSQSLSQNAFNMGQKHRCTSLGAFRVDLPLQFEFHFSN